MKGESRFSHDNDYASTDEGDSCPAQGRDGLMEKGISKNRGQNIAKRCEWDDKRNIG